MSAIQITKEKLYTHGLANIDDAIFIADNYLPLLIGTKRWNLAIYEAHRVTELLLKGILRILGCDPPNNHGIFGLISLLQEPQVTTDTNPIFTAVIPGNHGTCYVLRSKTVANNHRIELGKITSGTYTALMTGTSPSFYRDDIEIELDGNAIRLLIPGKDKDYLPAMNIQPNTSIKSPLKFRRPSDTTRLTELGKITGWLSAHYRAASYSEQTYDENDAMRAIEIMNRIRSAAETFFVTDFVLNGHYR